MYKVVRITEKNKRRSCIMSKMFKNTDLIIKYPVKIWIKPKIGKIFVFKLLENAQVFAKSEECGNKFIMEVWECEVKNPEKIYVIAALNIYDIKFFWQGGAFIDWIAPDGTYVCDAVKLVKKVE